MFIALFIVAWLVIAIVLFFSSPFIKIGLFNDLSVFDAIMWPTLLFIGIIWTILKKLEFIGKWLEAIRDRMVASIQEAKQSKQNKEWDNQ